jgi:hypothetical protein
MTRFNLVYSGEISEDFELEQVKQNFKNYFRLSDDKIDLIFSGKTITLKKALVQEKALEFAIKIDELGGVSYFEPINDDIVLPAGVYIDRRKAERRIKKDRRKTYRAGINTDRRVHADRRASSYA